VSDAARGIEKETQKRLNPCNTDASVFIISSRARERRAMPRVKKKSRAKPREDAVMSDGPGSRMSRTRRDCIFFQHPTRNLARQIRKELMKEI